MENDKPDYEGRQQALQRAMHNENLSALVAFGLSSYAGSGSSSHGYIRYLTGWTARFGATMLLQPAQGTPTLLVPSAHDALYLRESFPWVKRSLAEPPRGYGKLARLILAKWGSLRVGLVGLSDMPQPVYEDLTAGDTSVSFLPADSLIDNLRLARDPFEIEWHRLAARISDQMIGALVDRLRDYRGPAWKLMAEVDCTGRSLGAELATCWLVAGQPADRPRYRLEENQRRIQDGDQVLVGTYVTYRGYWSHCLRMGSLGPPSSDYRRIHEAALEQHRAAADQIRPGGDARMIQSEALRVAEELLPGSTGYLARFRQAHFMGLDYAEKPSAQAFPQPDNWFQGHPATTSEVILRLGMVIEVHTNLGLGGVGFGVMGDPYLVGERGAERLTGFSQDLFEV